MSESGDCLVQWCHGAPGMLMLFSFAYIIYSSDKKSSDLFLKEAKDCADVIWERGMVLKSYGLCHGVAGRCFIFCAPIYCDQWFSVIIMKPFPFKGNAYALLRIYQVTHDEKYLHRAFALAEYCADFGNGNLRHAEQYLSLFEGKKKLTKQFFSSFKFKVTNSACRTRWRALPSDRPAESKTILLSRLSNLQLGGLWTHSGKLKKAALTKNRFIEMRVFTGQFRTGERGWSGRWINEKSDASTQAMRG